jgi:predicted permease
MAALIDVVLPVFLVIGVAALSQRWLRLDGQTLSRIVFYIFGPALVFDSLTSSNVSGAEFGQIAAVLLLTTAVLWVLGAIAGRLLRLEGPTMAAFLVAILMMNAGNYGLSVNLFAFGEPGLARASLFFTVSALLSSSLGVYLSAHSKASAGLALRRMASVPMGYAALFGLLINLGNIAMPELLQKAIHLLGQASVPTMLGVLGLKLVETLKGERNGIHIPALIVVTAGRLIVAPALAWLWCTVLGVQGLTRNVTVLESAMPTAVVATILATEFESDPPFAALSVMITTLVSLPTVTILLNWLS